MEVKGPGVVSARPTSSPTQNSPRTSSTPEKKPTPRPEKAADNSAAAVLEISTQNVEQSTSLPEAKNPSPNVEQPTEAKTQAPAREATSIPAPRERVVGDAGRFTQQQPAESAADASQPADAGTQAVEQDQNPAPVNTSRNDLRPKINQAPPQAAANAAVVSAPRSNQSSSRNSEVVSSPAPVNAPVRETETNKLDQAQVATRNESVTPRNPAAAADRPKIRPAEQGGQQTGVASAPLPVPAQTPEARVQADFKQSEKRAETAFESAVVNRIADEAEGTSAGLPRSTPAPGAPGANQASADLTKSNPASVTVKA